MLKNFPKKYFIITAVVILECYFYIYGDMHSNYADIDWDDSSGKTVITEIDKGSNAEKAGLKAGDIILSIQNEKIAPFMLIPFPDQFKPGSIVNYEIHRNGKRFIIPVKLKTDWEKNKIFFIFYYILVAFVIFIGYFILFKKPGEKSSKLFFIFTQIFAICLNSDLYVNGNYGMIRTVIFVLVFPFLGPFVTYFFLYFPQRSRIIDKIKFLLHVMFTLSIPVSLFMALTTINFYYKTNNYTDGLFTLALKIGLFWMGLTLLAAILVSLYNFFTIKEFVAHNQLRWIMIGIVVGLLPEMLFGFGMQPNINFNEIIPHSQDFVWAVGTIIMFVCISFAILRYRLWDIEIIIKRSLLYFSLTIVLICGYLLLYKLSGIVVNENTDASRLIGLLFSAALFIPSREFLQKRIDTFFHREDYDPTSAALNFEHKLIGKYDSKNLILDICCEIDNIFHFSSFAFSTTSGDGSLVVKCGLGKAKSYEGINFELPLTLNKIKNTETIAVSELQNKPKFFNAINAEVITKVNYESILSGIFICGSKKSEKIYTRQDIEMLNLLANRTAAILQISKLYKAELERQKLIERERLRISKDMHDEVGSSLTKIAILSEMIRQEINNRSKAESSLSKISEISREVIDNMSEIIWAINPKNDKLDNLAAYLREYAYEFLEGTKIECQFNFMENYPPVALSAEFRRNIFLVVKESLNNVVKHSSANKVTLKFIYDEPYLIINIKDNGKGYSENKISKFGNGLNNISKRVEDIGGKLNITSAPGKGVLTEINVKLN